MVDEFCKEYTKVQEAHLINESITKKKNRAFTLSDSEVITIIIYFHLGGYRCMKHYYMGYVQKHMQSEFPKIVSYNRFVELQKKCLIPLTLFLQLTCLGKCTGISFIDSRPIRVCHIKRKTT